ncbi:uncharacterized protein LOC133197071 [Saccostrea echinata]|uniref:uncharacterized protein LOC133197071 n=1 Tax=Saccostrea echinata TaxID=191078 RepID=UPI002A81FADD|nr:uncharacterized protein LOC133197071 [Saccostrea echinata]
MFPLFSEGRKQKKTIYSLILGLGIALPFHLVAIAIIFIVCVYCQRRSQRRELTKQSNLDRSTIRVRYGSWGPKSIFSPWGQESGERKETSTTRSSQFGKGNWYSATIGSGDPNLSEHLRDIMPSFIPPDVSFGSPLILFSSD